MKKQILTLMACAAFLVPTSGFCMETEEDKQKQSLRLVMKAPELLINVLSYLHLPNGYSVKLMSKKDDLSKIYYGELAVFSEDGQNLYCKIAEKEKIPLIRKSYDDWREHDISSKEYDNILKHISRINVIENSNFTEEELINNNRNFHLFEFSYPWSPLGLLNYTKAKGYTLQDLKTTELVSQKFFRASRFFITSIRTPYWATDNDLIKYAETVPQLRALKIVSRHVEMSPENRLEETLSKITDESVRTLTHLTTLHLDSDANVSNDCLRKLTNLSTLKLQCVDITDEGIHTLTNLTCLDLINFWDMTDNALIIYTIANPTCLDLENFWDVTDDALISSPKPRHPKLKSLLLPNTDEHKITDDTMDLLAASGVTVKESDYYSTCNIDLSIYHPD